MTQKIYSQKNPEVLLASILSVESVAARMNAADADEILQVSALRFPKYKHVKSHAHLPTRRTTVGTQEAWVVFSGRVLANVYDTDNRPVSQVTLAAGDCMVLYRGGHDLTVLDDDTVIFEIKNGPYYGPEHDATAR